MSGTLYTSEQLVEKAVLPWNCFNRDDVDVQSLGMFPIFWTTKAGRSKIYIIIDLRRLNKFLSQHCCTLHGSAAVGTEQQAKS